MMNKIAHHLLAAISLITATGVFMHDGRVDKALITATKHDNESKMRTAQEPISTRVRTIMEADAHTHPDHNAGRSLLHGFTYQSPSIPPRDEQKAKAVLKLIQVPQGRHAFDNSNLPILYD